MSCRNLGDAFEKSIYLFIFWEKKKKKPHHGIPAGLRLLLAASFLTYENPGTSSKATFLCMVKARVSVGGRQRAGSRALIVQPSQVTLRGCGHISWYFTSFCVGAVSVEKKWTTENMDTPLKFFLPYLQCLISWF